MKIVHYHVNGCFDWLISGYQSVSPSREAMSILSGKYKRFTFVHPVGTNAKFFSIKIIRVFQKLTSTDNTVTTSQSVPKESRVLISYISLQKTLGKVSPILVALTSRSDSNFESSNVSLKEAKPDGVIPNSNDIDYYVRKNEGKIIWFSAD